jgi:hypothetical protein
MPERPRLVADATRAFVDHAAIDWRALLGRLGRPADRALIENLRLLDEMRRGTRPREAGAGPARPLVALLVVVAALQTLASLSIVALAATHGEALHTRASQLVLALAYTGASLLLAAAAPRDARSMVLLAAFISAASAFARTMLLDLPVARAALVAPLVRGLYPEAFTPACLWQFALDFPRVRRFTRFDRLARLATTAAWLMGAGLFIVNLLAAYGVVELHAITWLRRDHPSQAFWRLFTLGLAPPIAAILVRARLAPPSERRKVWRFALAIAIGTCPFLILGLARVAAPLVALPIDVGGYRRLVDWVIVGALVAMPLLVTAAVIVDRPFDLDAVRRITMRATLAVRARRRAPHSSSPHEPLAHALDRLRLARGRRELGRALRQQLRAGTGALRVHLLTPTSTGDYTDEGAAIDPLPGGSALVAMLRDAAGPLDVARSGPVRSLLPRADRAWLAQSHVALAAPLTRRDGVLAAIVVLERAGGLPFSRAERWWVASLMPAAAAMWEAEPEAAAHRGRLARRRRGDGEEAAFECPQCGIVSETMALPCGHREAATLASLPRLLAGKFTVERRLGRGGMGVAYLARDPALGRDVVLKTLPAPGPSRVARLQREAHAMATLRHDAIATLYGLERWRQTPVLVVEYFPRGTLADRLARGALADVDALAVSVGLAGGLAHIHAHGLLHGDVKPANIAMTGEGEARLLDFGLAALIARDEEADPGAGPGREALPAAGTPAYLPPEAHLGASPTAAVDLWGLSVVTLEAMTGANPFVADTRADTAQHILDGRRLTAYLSDAALHPVVVSFFARALARQPEARFPTAVALRDALRQLAGRLRSAE